MKNNLRSTQKGKLKTRTRLLMAISIGTAVTLFVGGVFLIVNMSKSNLTKASGGIGGNGLNNGEIISQFLWNDNPVTMATIGPNAISSGSKACSAAGGRYNSNGLSAGLRGKDINLTLADSKTFNTEGIDISIDFRRCEPGGNFFTRGSAFNFGFSKGFITITYRVQKGVSGYETVNAITDYLIPEDDIYRTYRFIYTPATGKGEIFVNSVPVWFHDGTDNVKLNWTDGGNVVIANGIDGNGTGKTILDNLIVRTAGATLPVSQSMLHFDAVPSGNAVSLEWTTAVESPGDIYAIERSNNGENFARIGMQNAMADVATGNTYRFIDSKPAAGINYYRIKQIQNSGLYNTFTPVGLFFRNAPGSFAIDGLGEQPFHDSFDISYYVPSSGRITLTLTDAEGKIFCSESFDATQGKNLHVFNDRYDLHAGTYNLNLAFGKSVISKKIMKA